MWQVTVICPGARRCNVKATPNTVLLQVLEQACSRQKLDPALYTIKYHGKQLDLSLSLRFSGIPNNGKVELVETERPRSDDGEVVVAIQNVDGTRVQSSFHSTMSLWEVLVHHKLDSSPDGMEPCLSYMRQEVSGEKALRSTQLRSIGLSSGRGVLRLSHRTVGQSEEVADKPVVSANMRGQESDKKVVKTISKEGGEISVRSDDDEPRRKPPPTSDVAMDTTEEGPYFPAHPISYFPPENETSGGPDQMEGVEISNPSPHPTPLSLDPQSSAAAAMALISGALQQPNSFPPEVVAAQMEEVTSSPFAQFAGVMRPHPLAPPISPPQPKVYDEPCDREPVVYSLDDPLPLPAPEEVSDNFFEHTVTDMHVMHSDLKRQASTSDAPLMTRAMRAVRDEMKLEKYKKSVVRVYFSDRWVLQGCFRPRESLKMLVKFIRDYLAEPNTKFHLYTTPPKTVLRSGKVTFAEAGFLPTAVVYVGVEDGQPHPQLSDSAHQQAMSALQALIIQEKNRPLSEKKHHSSPHPDRVDPSNQTSLVPSLPSGASSTTATSGRGQSGPASGGDGGTSSKLPKWFRTGPR